MSSAEKTVFLSPKAENDLEDIWLYTYQNWSIEQADAYHNLIVKQIYDVAKGIGLSREAPELGKSVKRSIAGSHIIYFRETETAVTIIRVLHGRMDPVRHI